MGIYTLTLGALIFAHYQLRRDDTATAVGPDTRLIVVLGGGILDDGRLGYASYRRTIYAVELSEAVSGVHLVFSDGDQAVETGAFAAEKMRDVARSKGFPSDSIHVDIKARSTLGNLVHATAIARNLGAAPDLGDVIFVTDTTHLPRVRVLGWLMGLGWLRVSPTNTLDDYGFFSGWLVTVAREAGAWWWNVVKVVAWHGLALTGLSPAERLEYVH